MMAAPESSASSPSSAPSTLVPALMRAEQAAAFLGEKSVRAFRRRVGKIYSSPIKVPGRGEVWAREDLDRDVARLRGHVEAIRDAADVL